MGKIQQDAMSSFNRHCTHIPLIYYEQGFHQVDRSVHYSVVCAVVHAYGRALETDAIRREDFRPSRHWNKPQADQQSRIAHGLKYAAYGWDFNYKELCYALLEFWMKTLDRESHGQLPPLPDVKELTAHVSEKLGLL